MVENVNYSFKYYEDADLSFLSAVDKTTIKKGKKKEVYNEIVITCDTETSKSSVNTYDKDGKVIPVTNYVVAWTITIAQQQDNKLLMTIWGNKPSQMVETMDKMQQIMGDKTFYCFHNLPYDYTFLRLFLKKQFGKFESQINVRSQYGIRTEYSNGVILKDTLILFQRKLSKVGQDYNCAHAKTDGWNYDKIRTQNEKYSDEELEYIENDTVVLAEALIAIADSLNLTTTNLPLTSTGIARRQVRNLGAAVKAHDDYVKRALTYEQYKKCKQIYAGGFTHCNRFYKGKIIGTTDICDVKGEVRAFDFSSSYPYIMISKPDFPMSKFEEIDLDFDEIMNVYDTHICIFKLTLIRPVLKHGVAMPPLQISKLVNHSSDLQEDNGRVLGCTYCEIYVSSIKAKLIKDCYNADAFLVSEVEIAEKGYLPKWFRDYVFELYKAKCLEKPTTDMPDYLDRKVAYALKKVVLNAQYGNIAMLLDKPDIIELSDGSYVNGPEKDFMDYIKTASSHNAILNYQWAITITDLAMANLFELFTFCENPVYCDTDSCYGFGWNYDGVKSYNDKCEQELIRAGYQPIYNVKGRKFVPGIAETDDEEDVYKEYRAHHAKCYAGRHAHDGKLVITLAGCPKSGAQCLNNDIRNFKEGFIFDAKIINKKSHSYLMVEKITIDDNGNEIGDSIDLNPCNFKMTEGNYNEDWEETLYNSTEFMSFQVFE